MIMLEIKNITKIYETDGFRQKALDKVSVNFRECEFASILGPSGSGKTTFLNLIENDLQNDSDAAVLHYDNLHEGGEKAKGDAGLRDDFSLLATLVQSSEGEQIVMNLGTTARKIGLFVHKNASNHKEIWVLLDAIDSGLSVDNIENVKTNLFATIIRDFEKIESCEVYIIVSANSYEFCRSSNCFDVRSGEYIQFKDYEDYRKFIFQSAEDKHKRYSQ